MGILSIKAKQKKKGDKTKLLLNDIIYQNNKFVNGIFVYVVGYLFVLISDSTSKLVI